MNVASLIMTGVLAFGIGEYTGPIVSGGGAEKVEVAPGAMRMTVRIEAKADTLDKAIADIQAQFADIKSKLAPTNPAEGTLKMKGPALAAGSTPEQVRIMQMMRGRFTRGDTSIEEKKEGKKEVALQATVGAEWKLTGADPVGLLRESEKIREAVTSAMPKKAGAAKEPRTEEEEERALMEASGGEAAMKPGEPVFAFVAVLGKDRLNKARQAAYAKAKENAEATAEAAGGKLGALSSVGSNVNAANAGDEWGGMDYYAMRAIRSSMGMMFGGGYEETEGVSPTLREITFLVSVNAGFALEK